MAAVRLSWSPGGSATLQAVQGMSMMFRSTIPFAPGSRAEARVDSLGVRFTIKMHRSKLMPEGDYALEGRPIDLTKTVREQLMSLLEAS